MSNSHYGITSMDQISTSNGVYHYFPQNEHCQARMDYLIHLTANHVMMNTIAMISTIITETIVHPRKKMWTHFYNTCFICTNLHGKWTK